MATVKRLIDANAFIEKECQRCGMGCDLDNTICHNMQHILNAPTVDAVEVVRCKDCRYRIHDDVTNEWFCNSWYSGFVYAKPNDFCSYGERMCPDE